MRKLTIAMIAAFLLVFAITTPPIGDAKRGGFFRSGVKSYKPTPKKTDQIDRSNSPTSSTRSTGAATSSIRGFFGGGGLMKGLMIGGLAGLLFGGMFNNLGLWGEMLGLLVNVATAGLLIMFMLVFVRKYKERRNSPQQEPRRWN